VWLHPFYDRCTIGVHRAHLIGKDAVQARCVEGFVYLDTSGAIVRDPEELSRIRSLAILPAWQDVWIAE
jgi:DNA topoisomerase IB